MSGIDLGSAERPDPSPPDGSPSIEGHRVLGDGRTTALLRDDGTVDWWCAPLPHSDPLLWSLLDPSGGTCGFRGLDVPLAGSAPPRGPIAAPVLESELVAGGRVALRDALFPCALGGSTLVRSVHAPAERVRLGHDVRLAGFGGARIRWERDGAEVAGRRWQLHVIGAEVEEQGDDLTAVLELEPGARPVLIVLTADPTFELRADDLLARLAAAAEQAGVGAHDGHLPPGPARRLADGLDVLRVCTYEPTGAIVAAVTTSLPEAPGADRQFDYRYSWLRDGSLGAAVSAVAGEADVAAGHLQFLEMIGPTGILESPLRTVDGAPVPDERVVEGVAGWEGSLPVRTGNGAVGQLQYDALGFVVESIGIVAREGGGLPDGLWDLVCTIADRVAAGPHGPSSGIWELRTAAPLVAADIGVWMALDHAIRLGEGHRGGAPDRWRAAHASAGRRVRGAVLPDGTLPQAYSPGPSATPVPDASGLMAVICGLFEPGEPVAESIVLRCIDDLGVGPHLHRYPPGDHDDFHGVEATFVPCSFWAVTALATVGRHDEAADRFAELDATLPRLLAEEWDVAGGRALGNVPLAWSHIESIRALYALDGSITA